MNKEFEVKFGSVIFDKINTVRKNDKDLNRMLNKLTETLGG